ncbi:GL16617 [Drosophila persimilis]|uniref:GL16617 n=1 Tax=Drosophila persimilis TaxID=7234 RepID=B4IQX1_DROPE|nr:GL16617 [Drosophila persimilis]
MPTGHEDSKQLLSVTSPSVKRPRSSSAPETPTSVTRIVKSPGTPGPTTSSAGSKTKSVLFPSPVTLKVPARTQSSPSHSRPSHTMAQSAATAAMAKFEAASRKLMHFGERINLPNPRTPSASLATVRRDQIRTMWAEVEAEHKNCFAFLAEEGPHVEADLQSKFDDCFTVYSALLISLISSNNQQSVLPHSQISTAAAVFEH